MSQAGETREALRRASALVYVEELSDPVVSEEDLHHLSRVKRLRDGEVVIAADGRGSFRRCRVLSASREGFRLDPGGPIESYQPPGPAIVIAFSLVKGERTEWAVEKLTEAGADTIIPLLCERTVVRPGEEASERRSRRLRLIARQAAMQSRRLVLPAVSEPRSFAEVLGETASSCCLAEPGGGPVALDRPVVIVGPEGGYSPAELAGAAQLRAPSVSLGDGIFRTETAALAAAVLLGSLRSEPS